MENAADALKMAFAIFVFVIALSIVFSLIGHVKETADAVLFYTDKTNFYEEKVGDVGTPEGEIRKRSFSRYSCCCIV